MKTLLTISLLFTVTLLYGQAQLKLASDVWPPFTDVTSENAFAIDLVREALARDKVHTTNAIVNFDAVMTGIREGKFDGSAALWHNDERAAFLLFSEPYLENRLILVGKKGSDVSADTLAELQGKRIAVVGGYAYGDMLHVAKSAQLVIGTNDQENLQRLLKGEADYMLVDALLIEYLLQYQSEEAAQYLEIGKQTLMRLPLHFAIRKETPGAAGIIAGFNAQIAKMKTDGTYHRILQLNWISTDVDGDGIAELVLNGDKAGTQAPTNSYALLYPSRGLEKEARYVIEGSLYDDWDKVPEKYKVPLAQYEPNSDRGFGPVFKF